MEILELSKSFDFERLRNDLDSLGLPTDFTIVVLNEISSYWGKYFSGKALIKAYVAGLSYEMAFPHILHEVVHHFQHRHQAGFRRKYGVMHDKSFEALFESKLGEWELLYKNRG